MPEQWERRPDETPKAYAAFTVYRGLGSKRSLEAVAAKVAKRSRKGHEESGYIKAWSSKYEWVKRAAAYDDHLDEVRRKADEKAIAEMSKKHAEGMRKIFDRGLKRLNAIEEERIGGGLALDLAMQGMKGERLARGLSTESVHQDVQGDLNVSSDGIADGILDDPEATRLFCLALQHASAGKGKPGVVRDGGLEGPLDDAGSPEPAKR